jgi:hypothetical protein
MSMFTPPEMGGEYRITGNRYPRMRRPRRRGRIIAASLASALALAVLGWGTLQLVGIFSGKGTSDSAGGHSTDHGKCASSTVSRKAAAGGDKAATIGDKNADGAKEADAAKDADDNEKADGGGDGGKRPHGGKLPEPGDITVNVLNATSRGGLAKETAGELEKRGFKIGKIGNATTEFDKKVKKAGLLVGAPGSTTTDRMRVLGTQLDNTATRYDERNGKDIDLVLGNDFERLAKKQTATAALTQLTSPGREKPAPAAPSSPC